MTKLSQRKQYMNQVLNTDSAKDIRKKTTCSEKQVYEGYQHYPRNITHLHFFPLLQWSQQWLNRTISLGTSASMICNETRACKELSESNFFLPFCCYLLYNKNCGDNIAIAQSQKMLSRRNRVSMLLEVPALQVQSQWMPCLSLPNNCKYK